MTARVLWYAEYDDTYYDSGGTHLIGVFETPEDAMAYCDEEYEDAGLSEWSSAYDDVFAAGGKYKDGYIWTAYAIEIRPVPLGGEGN
jgi:hypothetical protein